MSKSSKILVFMSALIAGLLATNAVYAERELYFDAGFGQAKVDDDRPGIAVADDTTAWRLGAGFDFGNNIALEAGYLNLGDLEDVDDSGNFSGQTDGYTLSARFQMPLSDRLNASARVGAFIWESQLDTPLSTFRAKGEDLFYGISLDVDVSHNLTLSAEWDRFEFDDGEADALFAGLRVRF